MRLVTSTFLALALTSAALAQHAKPSADAANRGEQAMRALRNCWGEWITKLKGSRDPLQNVTDAIMLACNDQLTKAARAQSPKHLSLAEAIDALKEGGQRLVSMSLITARTTGDPKAEPKAPEPKTREGKLAHCDMLDAEWRMWAAEREGGVRVDMIEEHAQDDRRCRQAAHQLPLGSNR